MPLGRPLRNAFLSPGAVGTVRRRAARPASGCLAFRCSLSGHFAFLPLSEHQARCTAQLERRAGPGGHRAILCRLHPAQGQW